MIKKIFLAVFFLGSFSVSNLWAKLRVVTTVPDLQAIAQEVGGPFVDVDCIAKGTQDPHFIEAKPSFMLKSNRADLLISIGLDLEIGWLPSIIQGARNPKINPGQIGYLEVGPLVKPLEVPVGTITRAQGDVHPFGNPHVTLDPIRAGEIATHIATRLGELDSEHKGAFLRNAKTLQARLEQKVKQWKLKIEKSQVKKIVTYHKTLTYFLDRFNIKNPAILEPKPGIPPTSGHIMEVIKMIRNEKISLILVENFFDSTVTLKIKEGIPELRTATVPVGVQGAPGIKTIDDVYENLVKEICGPKIQL